MSCTIYYHNKNADKKPGTMAGTMKGHNKMSLLNILYPPVCAECDVDFVKEFYPGISCYTALFGMASWPVQYSIHEESYLKNIIFFGISKLLTTNTDSRDQETKIRLKF